MVLPLLLAAQITVIAHRGEHLQHAENSIAAIRSAIQLGADYVELDVRTTRDGKLVLMHDKTVDRTTDGHGQVKDLTLEEIQHLHMRGYGDGVPTFDDALDAAHGKIGIYVDWKEASPAAIYHALYAHGMLGNVVVYADQDELHQLQQLAPDVRVMPEADDSRDLKRSEELLKPKVVAFDENDFKPALIRQTLDMKADIYVDRLDEQDNAQAWQAAIDQGAKGIQTNHPAQLLQFLREKHLHP
jgi:glycerophosphoryl diester phosphodiesterase